MNILDRHTQPEQVSILHTLSPSLVNLPTGQKNLFTQMTEKL